MIQMFRSMFMFWTDSPLNIIVVTDGDSVKSVATFMGRVMMKETAERVFTTKSFLWRRVHDIPQVKVNYVDYKEILEKNKPFSKRLIAVTAQTKDNKTVEDDKYLAELFYIAPIYHLGFPALDKILVIDATDLEFHDDIKLLNDQFQYVTEGKLIGLGRVRSTNTTICDAKCLLSQVWTSRPIISNSWRPSDCFIQMRRPGRPGPRKASTLELSSTTSRPCGGLQCTTCT